MKAAASQSREGAQRKGLLALLALNLFLIGIIGAFTVRYYIAEPAAHRKAGPARRIEAMSALLSPGDAAVLRVEFAKKSEVIERVSDAYRLAREKVRLALRAEPYSLEAMRAAMAEARTQRLQLEELMQEVIATAAAKMTLEGRERLSAWPHKARASAAKTSPAFPVLNWFPWHS
jgi:uncharacterized membrane protein